MFFYSSDIKFNSDNDQIILFVCTLMGNTIPIFLSAFCHHFYCISKEWHKMCWFLDFMGILNGMLFGCISYIYVTFYCFDLFRTVFIISIIIMYLYTIMKCWEMYYNRMNRDKLIPNDRFPEFSLNLLRYAGITSFIPLLLTISLLKEYREEKDFITVFITSCIGPLMMALGIKIFGQGGFPEQFMFKYFKIPLKRFEYIGHSHQFWHLISASLMFVWIYSLKFHYNARVKFGCRF